MRDMEQDAFRLHLDLEQLHRIADNSLDFEVELLQLFLQDSRAHLEKLKQAIASHDFWQVEQSAHHIKGASANIGARVMQLTAKALEQKAWYQQLEAANDLVAELEFSLNQIQIFLDRQIKLD